MLPYELVKYLNICFKCLIKWTKKFTVFLVIQYTCIILLLSLPQNICKIWNGVYVFHTYCGNSKYKCSSITDWVVILYKGHVQYPYDNWQLGGEDWVHETTLVMLVFVEVPLPSQKSERSCFCLFLRFFNLILKLLRQSVIFVFLILLLIIYVCVFL